MFNVLLVPFLALTFLSHSSSLLDRLSRLSRMGSTSNLLLNYLSISFAHTKESVPAHGRPIESVASRICRIYGYATSRPATHFLEVVDKVVSRSLLGKLIQVVIIALAALIIFGAYVLPPRVCALDVIISPGEDIQASIDKNPEGTTFILKPGVYRCQSLRPMNGNSFIGEPGAILSGARVLSLFEQQGQYWVTTQKLTQSAVQGVCKPDFPGCGFPEDIFIDDAPLRRVTKLDDVGLGKWYFDYNTNRIYLPDNPAGHNVEMSVTRYAFYGSASNVTISGLIVEKYANLAQTGAIHAMKDPGPLSQNWVIQQNEIRFNHGAGVRLGHQAHVLQNKIHHNGQIGISGGGSNVLIEGNEIAFNNYAGYSFSWEAGGTKFSFSDGRWSVTIPCITMMAPVSGPMEIIPPWYTNTTGQQRIKSQVSFMKSASTRQFAIIPLMQMVSMKPATVCGMAPAS